jgi:hypothetical protein
MATKLNIGRPTKLNVVGGFVKPGKINVGSNKVSIGGIVMSAAESEPMGRMAAPSGAGGSGATENIPETAETFAAVETSFNWTYVIIGLVAVVVLYFVFKKK